jgi:hypothetical protein
MHKKIGKLERIFNISVDYLQLTLCCIGLNVARQKQKHILCANKRTFKYPQRPCHWPDSSVNKRKLNTYSPDRIVCGNVRDLLETSLLMIMEIKLMLYRTTA